MNNGKVLHKFSRYLKKKRLHPIRVFCFHQVSKEFEPETMWECDWTQIDVFKRIILDLKKKYTFISLPEVTEHLRNDRFRMKRYAALTADDGWASLKNIIPWLVEQKIPLTVFLNPLYMDGKHYQSRDTEEFLTKEEVMDLVTRYGDYITIASHGWSHKCCSGMDESEFAENVQKAESELSGLPGKIPFFAFPYGSYSMSNFAVLKNSQLVPVLMDGLQNYNDPLAVHRELFGE